MLQLNARVSECIGHAVDLEQRADAAANPELKADFLSIARRWRRMADTYAFVEQVERFLAETGRTGGASSYSASRPI